MENCSLWSTGADLNSGAGAAVFNKLLNIFLYSKFNIFYIKNSNKRVDFIIKKTIIYDLFLIKSIFLVIENKIPHSKKVPELIFLLSQGHMKQKNGGQWPILAAVSVCFSGRFGQKQIVSTVSAEIGLYWSFQLPFPLESGRIGTNRAESKKKKKKRHISASNARCRVGASPMRVRQPWSCTRAF